MLSQHNSSIAPRVHSIVDCTLLSVLLQAITVASQQFPRSLVSPLVSILLHDSEPPENLTWSSMATLSELGESFVQVAFVTHGNLVLYVDGKFWKLTRLYSYSNISQGSASTLHTLTRGIMRLGWVELEMSDSTHSTYSIQGYSCMCRIT